MRVLRLSSKRRSELIPITRHVEEAAAALGLKNGVVTVFVPHTTAGITINENADPDVVADILETLDRLIPWHADYRHTEGNAAAHVKASLMGSSVRVMVENGRLCLGTWQGIFFCEFDGPRTREVWVHAD